MASDKIDIKVNRIVLLLAITTGTLALGSFVRLIFLYLGKTGDFPATLNLFNMDAKNNIPIFFAIILLLTCSIILGIISNVSKTAPNGPKYGWAFLSLLFLLMALDKGVRIHEYLAGPVIALIRGGYPSLLLLISVVIGVLVGAAFLFYLIRFILKQSIRFRKSFFIALGIYLIGAILLDAIGSSFYHPDGNNNQINNIITVFEESTEMAGIIAFIRVFLTHIKHEFTPLNLFID
jgi:hypothetical protein